MTRASILLCATLLVATVAGAQTVQRLQVQPVPAPQAQPSPAIQATQVAPPARGVAQAVQPAPIGPVQTPEALEAANRKLREEIRLLRAENTTLRQRLTDMTTLGGSQVRAYCPTETTSRNTAGATADCGATGYTCEGVSGLCHKTCSSSAQCASGHSCNPCNNQCESNAGPITQC